MFQYIVIPTSPLFLTILFRRVKFQMWKVSLSKFDALVLINFQTFNTSSNLLTINVSTSLQDEGKVNVAPGLETFVDPCWTLSLPLFFVFIINKLISKRRLMSSHRT